MLEKISQLQHQYDILKNKSKRDTLNQQELESLPQHFTETLNEIPLDLIVPRLEKYANISQENLDQVGDQRQFISRLAEVAMEGIITEEKEAEPALGPVVFSRSPGMDSAVMSEFRDSDKTIFAKFSTLSFAEPSVFAKWYRIEDGEVMLFKQMPINLQDTNYIWVKNDNGFATGRYKVDIFKMSQEMELLSSGEYQVVNL